jgi:hypothetical protein
MKLNTKLLPFCLFFLFLGGCDGFLKQTAISKATIKTIKIYSDYNLLPKNQTWLEAQFFYGKWARFLPCKYVRKFATFNIIGTNNKSQIIWNNGIEIQNFNIEDLKYSDKYFLIKTHLPFKPSEKIIFQLKKSKKNVFEWKVYNKSYFFIAQKDLAQFLQISETCEE